MGRITLMLVGAVVAAIATGSADAQESSAAIKERREHMKAMGGSMQSIGKYLKGEGVTLDQARGAATSLRQHADANLTGLFPPGTGVGVGESKAKPEIWVRNGEFQQGYQRLRAAAGTLEEAVQSGEQPRIATAVQDTGKACAGCHDSFRAPLK
jgi:cytochrome c556